ncbi:16633_t:CDS:2 [Acaulospora morrowiae]|uniref:16633_t:CDS:1 n=1 Tax=Acaulospora morrowiae TaxID=94023 RepID=A0A9N9GKF8_9GLOM|nr:16633_t:CDS:2 [Acaulospora morrowiae]
MSNVIIDSSSESVKREVHIDAGDHECWGSKRYCGECTRKFFQEQPSNWTSGNSEIDKIIRESQESGRNVNNSLEWIPFKQFYDIREVDKGAFSIVYLAYWMDGPLLMKAFPDEVSLKKNEKRIRMFYREGPIKVILKKLKKSQNISAEFINELKVHYKLYCKDLRKNVIRLFGISNDPTDGEFYMVLEYCEHGNMRRYLKLNSNSESLEWWWILFHIMSVFDSLSYIHKEGFTHNDLHSGNLLFTNFENRDALELKIADLGLSGPANQTRENEILKENLELRDLYGYSTLDEFADDVWEFKLKMFDISCRDANHQMEMHPKAIYTSQLISDLTKNVQWVSNELDRDNKYDSVQGRLKIDF